jgi:hypothetical protein
MNDGRMRLFITGASSGIGEALARHYAGVNVAAGVKAADETPVTLGLAARRQRRLFDLLAELPGTHAAYPLDVTDAAALGAAAKDFITRFGCPDIVIANAGVSVGTLTSEADDLPAFRRVLDTNVLGMVHTSPHLSRPCKRAAAARWWALPPWRGYAGCRVRAPIRRPKRRPLPIWKRCVLNCAAAAFAW